jgi:hypothetical protein
MTRHLKPTTALILLALIPAFAPAGGEKDKAKVLVDNANYYPLEVGNTWEYKLTANGNVVTMVSKIAKIEEIEGKSLSLLEAAVNGNVAATEHLQRTKAGIERFRTNGIAATPPFLLLKYPVKPGETWGGEFVAANDKGKYTSQATAETVEVPAGKYKTIRVAVKLEVKGQIINTTYWFARDVGFVKQTVDAPNLNVVIELQKFEPKKAAGQ